MSARRRRLLLGGREQAFNLLATTTAPGQTVTLYTIAAYAPTAVVWGDGAVTQVPANTDTTPSHIYAAAGDYYITIPNARVLTKIHIQDSKVHGINTRDLRGCRKMHTFYLYNLSAPDIVVNSTDMIGWGLSTKFYFRNCPNATGALNSADMIGWKLSNTFFLATSIPGTINSIDMIGWGLSSQFYLGYCAGITGTVNSTDMAGWGLSYQFYFNNCPNLTYVCQNPEDIVWTALRSFYANNVHASLATVNNTIQGFWNLRNSITYATPNLNLGGASNATPSGVYQSACPPTSALEQVYNLANVQCPGDTHNPWTVTWNGGSAP